MGCTASRLEEGEECQPAMLAPVRRRIDEAKMNRRRAARKDSIVSTTELLTPDEVESVDDSKGLLPDVIAEEEEGLNEDDSVHRNDGDLAEVDDEKGRRLTKHDDDDDGDLQGSPSFRVYFADDGVRKADFVGNVAGAVAGEGGGVNGNILPNSTEAEEQNTGKRASKGKRLVVPVKRRRSLGFFGVRSCYNLYHQEPQPNPSAIHEGGGSGSGSSSSKKRPLVEA